MILDQIKTTLEELNSNSSDAESSDLEFPDRNNTFDSEKLNNKNEKQADILEQTRQLEVSEI